MTGNVLSQVWLVQNKSIMTTFNSIDIIYRIALEIQHIHIEMAKDSLYDLIKQQVQQLLSHVNNYNITIIIMFPNMPK